MTLLERLPQELLRRVLSDVEPYEALFVRQQSRRTRDMVALESLAMPVEGCMTLLRRHAPRHTREVWKLGLDGPLLFIASPLQALLRQRGPACLPRLRRLELTHLPATDELPAFLRVAAESLPSLEVVSVSSSRCNNLPQLLRAARAVVEVHLAFAHVDEADDAEADDDDDEERPRLSRLSLEVDDGALTPASVAVLDDVTPGLSSLSMALGENDHRGAAERGAALAVALQAATGLAKLCLSVGVAAPPDWDFMACLGRLTRLETDRWPSSMTAFRLPSLRELVINDADAPVREVALAFPTLETLCCRGLVELDAVVLESAGPESDWDVLQDALRAAGGGMLQVPPLKRLYLTGVNAMGRSGSALVSAFLLRVKPTLKELRVEASFPMDPYLHRILDVLAGATAFPRLCSVEVRGFSLSLSHTWSVLARLARWPGMELRVMGCVNTSERRMRELHEAAGGRLVCDASGEDASAV